MTDEITKIIGLPVGASLVYHVGFLALDRGQSDRTEKQSAVNETANIAWKLYERGTVNLVQKRHGENNYSYMAVRRPAR